MERKKIFKFESKILSVKQLTKDTKHLTISVPDNFDFYPGQFISLITNKNGNEIRRPYSIASKPAKNSIELCIKILRKGLITPIIDNLKIGDKINIIGPMGSFVINEESKDKNIILISTGTGIAPFRSIALHLLENNFY